MAYLITFIFAVCIANIPIFSSELLEERDNLDRTFLHTVAYTRGDDVSHAQELIRSGSGLDARDGFEYTPLILAMIAGNRLIAEELIKAGADPNCVDRYGRSALYYALTKHDNVLISLIANCEGLMMNVMDRYGLTPMHWVACYGDLEMMQLLCAKGALIHLTTSASKNDARFATNTTPLLLGSQGGNAETIQFLLERLLERLGSQELKEHIELTDKGGRKALQWALHAKSPEIAKLLLKFGALPKIRSNLYIPPSMENWIMSHGITREK